MERHARGTQRRGRFRPGPAGRRRAHSGGRQRLGRAGGLRRPPGEGVAQPHQPRCRGRPQRRCCRGRCSLCVLSRQRCLLARRRAGATARAARRQLEHRAERAGVHRAASGGVGRSGPHPGSEVAARAQSIRPLRARPTREWARSGTSTSPSAPVKCSDATRSREWVASTRRPISVRKTSTSACACGRRAGGSCNLPMRAATIRRAAPSAGCSPGEACGTAWPWFVISGDTAAQPSGTPRR